jgi:hypothetical protein
LKLTSLNVSVRKSPTATPPTKTVIHPAQPKPITKTSIPAAPVAAAKLSAVPVATATPVKAAISSAERRRNQRVLLRIRASLHVALQGKAAKLDAATLSVTAQGAVVVTNQNLPAETRLVLEHGGTGQRVDCKVARPPRETAEGFHTPIEFSAPAPGFWKINFPPSGAAPEES